MTAIVAGGKGLILATVLSVMVSAEPSAIGDRVAGWVFAGIVGSVALVALWPERPRPRVRLGLASIARDLASAPGCAGNGSDQDFDGIADGVTVLREQADSVLTRPGGPRSCDQALLFLMDELGRADVFARRISAGMTDGVTLTPADTALRVGLGAAVSVILAVLMWPRGVSHGVARAVAAESRAAVQYLRTSCNVVLGRGRGSRPICAPSSTRR